MIATIATMTAEAGSARAERLRMMNSHFTQVDSNVHFDIAIAAGVILAIFLLMKLVNHIQTRRRNGAVKIQPMSLYLRVQARMGFGWMDRWRLWRLARSSGLTHPTAILISPVLFDRAVQQHVGGFIGSSRALQLSGIRRRLFGEIAPLPLDSISTLDH